MTSADDPDIGVDEAVRRFTDAETALRQLLASAEQIRDATRQLEDAQAAIADAEHAGAQRLEEARTSLRRTESGLAEVSGAVFGLTVELKDSAAHLRETALAFRRLNPDELRAEITNIGDELAAIRTTQQRILVVAVLAALAAVASIVAAVA